MIKFDHPRTTVSNYSEFPNYKAAFKELKFIAKRWPIRELLGFEIPLFIFSLEGKGVITDSIPTAETLPTGSVVLLCYRASGKILYDNTRKLRFVKKVVGKDFRLPEMTAE